MDNNTIFSKTAKGLREATGATSDLARSLRTILKEIDGKRKLSDLRQKFEKYSDSDFHQAMRTLELEDYVRDTKHPDQTVVPFTSPQTTKKAASDDSLGDLDFTALASSAAEEKSGQEAAAKAKREAAQNAEALALIKAKKEAEEKLRRESAERAKREAEEKAKQAILAKTKQEAADKARREAEAAAKRAAEERAIKEAEEKARLAAEAAARKEEEERAQREAEERARRAAAEKAKREAEEQARKQAEERAKQAAEARARQEAEERLKREAEERSRQLAIERARKEAEETARREAELAVKKAVEEKARLEAEARIKAEAELRAQQEAAEKARREAEAARKAAEEKERIEREARLKAEAEVRAKHEAEEQARLEAEARLRKEVELRAQHEAAEKARREAEAEAKAEAEAEQAAAEKERVEREARMKAEAERRAQVEAEAEAQAKRETEERARREAELAAQKAAEEKARLETEARLKAEAELRAQQEAAEAAEREAAEERARLVVEANLKREAELLAQKEAAEKARREAEEAARREAEKAEKLAAWERSKQKAEEKLRQEAEQRLLREAEEKEKAEREAAEQAQRAAAESQRSEPTLDEAVDSLRPAPLLDRAEEDPLELRQSNKEKRNVRQEAERNVEALAAKMTARSSRFSEIRWGKLMAIVLIPLAIIAVARMHYISYDSRIPALTQRASEQLKQPVKVDALYFSLFPRPQWQLEGVMVGGKSQLFVPRVNAVIDLGAVFSDPWIFKSVELVSPVVSEEAVGWLLFGKTTTRNIKADAVTATNVAIDSPAIIMPHFDAKAAMGQDGNWQKVSLDIGNRDAYIELLSGAERVQFELNAITFLPPFGGKFEFNDFSAKGSFGPTEMVVSEFQGRNFGGAFTGNAVMSWVNGWRIGGVINAKQPNAKNLAPALIDRGHVDGKATFAMQTANARTLFAEPHIEGNFVVGQGVLLGVDLMHRLQGVADSGKTEFRQLSGSFVRNGDVTQFRSLRLDAGMLSATGSAELDANETLRGRFGASLNFDGQQNSTSLSLTGTLKQPKFGR